MRTLAPKARPAPASWSAVAAVRKVAIEAALE
jgi:hypothetical protein